LFPAVVSSGWELRLRLVSGLGVSLVDTQAREELAFCLLQGLSIRITLEHAVQRFDAQVLNIQVYHLFVLYCIIIIFNLVLQQTLKKDSDLKKNLLEE
jgi:hypothetical protein